LVKENKCVYTILGQSWSWFQPRIVLQKRLWSQQKRFKPRITQQKLKAKKHCKGKENKYSKPLRSLYGILVNLIVCGIGIITYFFCVVGWWLEFTQLNADK